MRSVSDGKVGAVVGGDIPLEVSCFRKGLFCVADAIVRVLLICLKLSRKSRDAIKVIDKPCRAEDGWREVSMLGVGGERARECSRCCCIGYLEFSNMTPAWFCRVKEVSLPHASVLK